MPRGHKPGFQRGCRHCEYLVTEYDAERERQEKEWGNGGFRDDPGMKNLITFRDWLRKYEYNDSMCER